MTSKKTDAGVDRRGFLKGVSGGAAGTAVAVATGIAVVPTAAEAAESKADRVKARYKETEHVKAYYRTNRY